MSFQAYLDAVEEKTGLTPRQIVDAAAARGHGPDSPATEVADWLKAEYGIGHGHAMAMVHVIRKGAYIGDKHVGSTGSHRDESDTLWLDGKATRPAP